MSQPTLYNLNNIDLSQWHLSVASFQIAMDDGVHKMDISFNSTITSFDGYDAFVKDIALMHTIKQQCSMNPAVDEAFKQLLTVMAITTVP